MASGGTTKRLRAASALVPVVGLVLAAALTRDATPTGHNRPPLARDPIGGRCWPLPTERHFDFAYQVRADDRKVRDSSGERRRVLTIQYDEVDAEHVRDDLDELLTTAGFVSTADGVFTKPDYGTVRLSVVPLPDLAADSIVRGVLGLDLPAVAARAEARGCAQTGSRP